LHPAEEANASNNDKDEGKSEDEHGRGLIEIGHSTPPVRARHLNCRVFNLVDHILEYLAIREHPISIEKEENGRVTEEFHRVNSHLVIHCWWQLETVCELISLSTPEDEVGEESDWEESRQAQSIHHGDVGNIEQLAILDVLAADVVGAIVHINQLVDLLLPRGVHPIVIGHTAATPLFRIFCL